MRARRRMVEGIGLAGALALVVLTSGGVSAEEFFAMKDGKLQRPTGYRGWVYVGTPLTPHDMNNGAAAFPEFHAVYIDPVSWAHWKKTGTFREGTILVKDMSAVGSKAATSGKGYFMGEFTGLEAAIKSSKLFPDEPGNWAYFTFSTHDHRSLERAVAPAPTSACNSCHTTAAADDWVYTQYYPVLRAAKARGEEATGGKQDTLEPAPYK